MHVTYIPMAINIQFQRAKIKVLDFVSCLHNFSILILGQQHLICQPMAKQIMISAAERLCPEISYASCIYVYVYIPFRSL